MNTSYPVEKCYRPISPFMDKRAFKSAVTFRFSPTAGECPIPWPEGNWVLNIRHVDDGKFNDVVLDNIDQHWTTINPVVTELPNVLGRFGRIEQQFPAFSLELKDAVEAVDPNLCSFVPVPKLYDRRHDRVIETPKYYFVAVRNFKDSIDVENSETGVIPRADGSTLVQILSKTRVFSSALKGAILWRDTRSREVLCNGLFKALAEEVGCMGMEFLPIQTTAD